VGTTRTARKGRTPRWRATLAALCLSAALAAAGQTAPQGKYGLYWARLDNGLEVIAIENPAQPLVTVEIAVKNGAYTEPPEWDGLSHLYEHMFFKGNEVIPDQERYNARLRELGGSFNGTTGDERVNYFLTLHRRHLWEGMAFMRDALRYPLFSQEELAREAPVVLGEFDRNEADPDFHLRREIDRRLWFRHFSRKNPLGSREVIVNVTREQMREIQRRYYVPNNSALIVGGDVDHDEVFDFAERLFGDWPASADPHRKWPVPKHPPLPATRRLAVEGPVQTATLELAWHGPGMKDDTPSTFAADVFSFILAQPDSAFQKALVDSGLFDAVELSYYSLVHTGPITLRAVTSPERLDRAWAALEAELARFVEPDYVTEDQIESAKNTLEVNEIYGREQTTAFCHTISFWWCTGGLDYYLNYIENLRRVGRPDIRRYVRRYILERPRVEAVLASTESLDQLEFARTAERVRSLAGAPADAAPSDESATALETRPFEVDGLKVVLRRNPRSEVIVAQMVLLGGVVFSGPEAAGRELVVLETLDKGSRRFSKDEISRQLARTGAQVLTEARHDYSTFGLRTLRRDWDTNFPLFADALVAPTLDDEEIKLALERRLNAVRRQQQSPDAYISLLASRNFYRGHPYAVPPTGTEASLGDLTPSMARRLHEATFTRARMMLFVVGDVTEEVLRQQIRRELADLPPGQFVRQETLRPTDLPPRLLTESRNLPTNYIFGCFEAPNQAHPDFPALQIAVSILSDRLFEEVRTKRNLSYAVAALVSSRRANYGVLYVTAVQPNPTVAVMLEEVRRLREEGIDEKVLRDKIEEMITEDLVATQSNLTQAARLILYEVNGGGWSEADGAIDKLREVTPDRVRQAAERYLKDFSFALLGPVQGLDSAIFGQAAPPP